MLGHQFGQNFVLGLDLLLQELDPFLLLLDLTGRTFLRLEGRSSVLKELFLPTIKHRGLQPQFLTQIGNRNTPEFSFEHESMNVENAVRTLNVTFPVAIDSKTRIWQSFNNQAGPAQYLVDAKGRIRYHHFGEGDYGEIERVIQELLKENEATGLASGTTGVSGVGVEAAHDWTDERSPETYIGYRQAQNFASPEKVHKDSIQIFSTPGKLSLNHWGLSGSWNVNAESAVLQVVPGKIVFRFHSRDLHFVLAPMKGAESPFALR